ncbi:MAG: hypothetical protein VXW87_04535, partial [Pseudomonadota bacterium]|nr:hypothetical protein [Pseudomonadota bacterium]
ATFDIQLLLAIELPENVEIIRLPMQTTKAVTGSKTLKELDTTNIDNARAVIKLFYNLFTVVGINSKHREGSVRLAIESVNIILSYVYHNVPECRFKPIDYKKDYTKELNKNNPTLVKQSIFLAQLSKDKAAALENKKQLELHSKSERLEIFVQAKSLNNKRWPH